MIESSDRYPEKFHGLRDSRWKYLIREQDGVEQLYDLVLDPLESVDLAVRFPRRLADLRAACVEALQQMRETALPMVERPLDDPETLERLRALGYDVGP